MSINPQIFIPWFFFSYILFPKSLRKASVSVSKESLSLETVINSIFIVVKVLRDHVFGALPFADEKSKGHRMIILCL